MRVLMPVLMLGLLACSDAVAPLEPPAEYAGTYVMATVNDQPLPFTLFQDGEESVELTAASVTLRTDGSFDDRATLRFTADGEVVSEEDVITGSYTVSQGRVRFLTSTGQVYEGVVEGETMTQTFDGLVLVYTRSAAD